MTSKLTRERIELIANFHRAMTLPPSHAEIEELARMALAAMDSEPVAYISKSDFNAGYPHILARRDFNKACTMAVYAAQPAPVVPDKMNYQDGVLFVLNNDMSSIERGTVAMRAWNACRAAMLAAAPQPQNEQQNIPEIIPGWIPVSERMPENDVSVLTFDGMYKRVHHAMYGHWQCWEPEKITHWMPLPAAPQEVPDGK